MLVHWRTLSPASATWENYNVLKQRFPEVDLAEGDPSQEGANVTHSSPSNQPDEEADSEAPVPQREESESQEDGEE